jgi:hypothetical protein
MRGAWFPSVYTSCDVPGGTTMDNSAPEVAPPAIVNVASPFGLMDVHNDVFKVGELKSSEVIADVVRTEKIHKNHINTIEYHNIFFIFSLLMCGCQILWAYYHNFIEFIDISDASGLDISKPLLIFPKPNFLILPSVR